MATEEQPTKKAKTWAHSIDNSTVHKLNFKEKVNWEKTTHPDAFPKDKPQEPRHALHQAHAVGELPD